MSFWGELEMWRGKGKIIRGYMKIPFLLLSEKMKPLSILIIIYTFCNTCNQKNKFFYEPNVLIQMKVNNSLGSQKQVYN